VQREVLRALEFLHLPRLTTTATESDMSTSLADLKNNGNAVAKKPKTIFDFLMDDKVKGAIGAVAGKIMTPDRFLRLAINAVKKTPRLLECDPQTVLGSFMASAALGLEPNTVLQQAFLIPYAKRGKLDNGQWGTIGYECQFQIGYRGFVTLAHRSPHVLTLEAEAIHSGDHFKHMKGSKSFLEYEKALKERGELIGAFAFSKLADNAEAATVLTLDDIHKIRDRSETYQSLLRGVDKGGQDWEKKKAAEKLADTPWVLWEDDMAAKSAIKKHAKQLPLNPGEAMTAAVALDADRDDGRTIDMADLADVDKLRSVMQDGDLPPEDAAAAIEHQEGNFIDMPTAAQRERETIVVRGVDEQPAQHAQAPNDDPVDAAKDKLVTAMRAAKDQDTLDVHADLIGSLPAGDQAEVTKVYRECTRALASGDAPRGTGRQMAMSIE
jgi:recombination protein RecT